MGSEQNDGTSYQSSEQPRPCANNCGFWGRSDTMDLCSKCYRDLQMKEQQAALAKAAMENSLSPQVDKTRQLEVPALVVGSSSSSLSLQGPVVESVPQKVANRCQSCNKKVGLTGFKCKCGFTFCGDHRYPEKHECSFDFKSVGRDEIAKANPVVKADKLERF